MYFDKGVDVDSLPTFDIEFVFLNIRAKSIGEDIKMTVTCPDDKTTQVPVTVYVDEIKVIKPKDHKIDIVLDDKMTLRMKYPSLNQFVNNNFTVDDDPESVVDKTFQVVADCMDTVYTGEDAWDASDYSPSERMDFVNQLSSKQYKQVEKFLTQCLNYLIQLKLLTQTQNKRVVSFWRPRDFSGEYCKRGSRIILSY